VPPPSMEETEIEFAFSRRVVTQMSSKVGLLSFLGRKGLGKPVMISATVSALLGAMVVVLFVCEGRGILDGNKV
jgi:hypothetical protein